MPLQELKQQVFEANQMLVSEGLVKLTWGNVSGIDRTEGLFAIKPSGVPYSSLRTDDLIVLDLDGKIVEGTLNPSSDTPTHLVLYQRFQGIGGICHTHSIYATMFAQAGKMIPCLGTTHADHFFGEVPIVRALEPEEVASNYEENTGHAIVDRIEELEIDPLATPGVLQAYHAPFTWGKDAIESVKNGVALEVCAQMALGTFSLDPDIPPLPDHILTKHFRRKHGPDAYYGQDQS
ncbi:MAG: L-ribulose-5-phosphate 4-epimerase AraD [Verrucomicrobiota bacterium]